MELGMAAGSVRYLCSCGTAALISYFGNRSCYCHSAATRAVKPRSHSCIPVRIQSPTSASVRVPNFDKWLSTTGASKSSLKDWMQYLSRFYPHVDVSSMSRALTSLHVDLPRSFPEIRRLVPSISIAQLQHIFHRTNSPGHYSVTGSSNQQSTLNSKSLADSAKPSSTEARRSPVHSNSNHLRYEEQPVAESPVSAVGKDDETKTSTASTQQRVISEAVTLPADKSRVTATMSTAPATDSVMTKVNTVASGIARQFAEYMPTVNTNTAAQTKSPTYLQQHRESLEIDSREKAKADEVKNETSAALPKQTSIRRQVVARASSDRQTCGLVLCLRNASTSTSQLVRLEELCQHISQYPDCTGIAVKNKVIPCLLRLRNSHDAKVAGTAREALALVGYIDTVSERGIRVLSLDGGGTKGLVLINIMRRLEELSRRKIHELFDYVCGVSTGALIGAMAAIYRVPVADMEDIYKEFSVQMFARNRLLGTSKLFTSHAYYDTELWERILRENIGYKSLQATNRDAECPKFSAVSTLVNVSRVQNFLFRNYNLPSVRQSHYAGSTQHLVWEAIRASSAAPGYYEECQLGDWVHQDGGLLTNNPAAIAIHECRLLWPDSPLQCIISIGTGKFEPGCQNVPVSRTSLKWKVEKLVESATDTEAVHTTLRDLLPASTYFRFNPYMSEEFMLDEVRADKWQQMQRDTEMYCRKNAQQLDHAISRLLQPKPLRRRIVDELTLKLDTVG